MLLRAGVRRSNTLLYGWGVEAWNLCYLIRCTFETAFKAEHQILNSDLRATFVYGYMKSLQMRLNLALRFSLSPQLVMLKKKSGYSL